MEHRSKAFLGSALGLVVMLTLLLFVERPAQEPEATATPTIQIIQLYSFVSIGREEMIDQSDAIFLGRVTDISPTRWNQDSGEEWVDSESGSGLQYHTIEFEMFERFVDTLGLGRQVTITALGISPLEGSADHDLQLGDQAVIFAVARDLAWRGGTTRPIVRLTNAPTESYYIQKDDGLYQGRWNEDSVSLEALIGRVAERRETLIQP